MIISYCRFNDLCMGPLRISAIAIFLILYFHLFHLEVSLRQQGRDWMILLVLNKSFYNIMIIIKDLTLHYGILNNIKVVI